MTYHHAFQRVLLTNLFHHQVGFPMNGSYVLYEEMRMATCLIVTE